MKLSTVGLLLLGSFYAVPTNAQSGSVIPEHGAGHAPEPSCVILKRMGPADEVTSHLYSFGIRGKQFQYIEGKLPDGFPFHGRLTDHDVRNLQARGAEVLVLESHYTTDDLSRARADCRGETGNTPNQSEAKAASPAAPAEQKSFATTHDPASLAHDPAPPAVKSTPVTAAAVPVQAFTGKLSVVSVPDGADIEVDGNFVGNAPSDIQLPDGEYTVTVKMSGFKSWQRKLKVSAGSNVRLRAELEKGTS